jgi:Wzt C-terminal domain
VLDPDFTLTFRNDLRHTIFVASTAVLPPRTGRFRTGEVVTLRFTFENLLAPSRYTISAAAGDRETRLEAYAFAEDVAAVLVQAPHFTGGVTDLPFEFEVERS